MKKTVLAIVAALAGVGVIVLVAMQLGNSTPSQTPVPVTASAANCATASAKLTAYLEKNTAAAVTQAGGVPGAPGTEVASLLTAATNACSHSALTPLENKVVAWETAGFKKATTQSTLPVDPTPAPTTTLPGAAPAPASPYTIPSTTPISLPPSAVATGPGSADHPIVASP